MIILPQVIITLAALNIFAIVIGIPMLILCYKRIKHTDEAVNEIIQMLNKIELDDVYYKIHGKPEDR